MKELKLVKVLLISVILQLLLLAPRIVNWVLKFLETLIKILRKTIESLIENSKKEILG
mgnify:FL=1|tara:strand:- start:523 stop:696 length:174 start_codon:yes stop_codon:yes gene_type:complete